MCDFFFFKQKTAYDVRISDWSSDVCSSDLDETVAVVVGFERVQNRGELTGELDVDDGADDLCDAARGGGGACSLRSRGLLRRSSLGRGGLLGGCLLFSGCGSHGLLPWVDQLERFGARFLRGATALPRRQ